MAKILVIDDDITTLTMFRLNLQKAGHEVVELQNGSNVFEVINNETPDLLICDIFMPHKDGIEILSELREVIADLPIIIISGGSSELHRVTEMLDMTDDLGANASLQKPVDMAELSDLIQKLTATK